MTRHALGDPDDWQTIHGGSLFAARSEARDAIKQLEAAHSLNLTEYAKRAQAAADALANLASLAALAARRTRR